MVDVTKSARAVLFAIPLLGLIGGVWLDQASANPVKSATFSEKTDRLIDDIALSNAFDRPGTCHGFDPVKRYGNTLQFQIRRNDAPVGRHTVTFNHGQDGLQVVAQTNIDISILGFNAYNFAYRSESMWRGDQMMRLSVTIDDDGEKTTITASRNQNRLIVNGPDGRSSLPATIFPTDHWHCGVLVGNLVLNTITGKSNDVEITPQGSEMLHTANGAIRATEFAYDGELRTNAWYDRQGRWVGLQFKGRDGSTITYRCMNCQTRNAQKDQE